MKVLAVSLLRMGDLLLAAPSLAALKKKHPDATIDLLVNRQAVQAAALIPFVNQVHIFERDEIQHGLLDATQPLMEPFFQVETLISKINEGDYDLVVNLTHNRLSGWICGLIQAKEYCGLVIERDGRPQFGSNWFRYLNEKADQLGKDMFHYADIFRFALAQSGAPVEFNWRINPDDLSLAAQFAKDAGRFVLLQPFTSEIKKEWGLDNWRHMAHLLSLEDPELKFLILGAPNEVARVTELVNLLQSAGVKSQPAITTLPVAAALIDHAELLITGDTSIKHLAIPSDCRVIELSLGSSDWHRTGIYRADCYILQPQVACAPCPHSEPCSQVHHACAQRLAPDVVTELAQVMRHQDNSRLARLVARLRGRVQLLRTGFADTGYWEPVKEGQELGAEELAHAVDKLATKLLLEGQHRKAIGEFGTEAVRLKQFLGREFPKVNSLTWQNLYQSVSREAERQKGEAEQITGRLAELVQATQSQPVVDLKEMRLLQNKIGDIGDRLEVRRRLLRSLIDAAEVVV